MEGVDAESKDEALRSQISIRCAKAAILLSSLKSLPSGHRPGTTVDDHDQEKDMLRRKIKDLKVELAKARLKNKRMKLCGLTEIILQVLVVIFLSSFFIMIGS